MAKRAVFLIFYLLSLLSAFSYLVVVLAHEHHVDAPVAVEVVKDVPVRNIYILRYLCYVVQCDYVVQ